MFSTTSQLFRIIFTHPSTKNTQLSKDTQPTKSSSKASINYKMRFPSFSSLFIPLASLFHGSSAVPQGVYEIITPSAGALPGCVTTYAPLFGVIAFEGPPRETEILRSCIEPTGLAMRLVNGVLVDSLGRIGSIVANRQFQFDGPPAQAGAIYTGGWSVCADGTLALGDSKKFYQCASGDCKCPSTIPTSGLPSSPSCFELFFVAVFKTQLLT